MLISTNVHPPAMFAHHNHRIIRGRFPDTGAVKFVTGLGIRKFVSLGIGFPGTPERTLGKSNKIELIHFPISPTESQNDQRLSDIIDYILVKNSDSKIYIYDDDGFSCTGIVCGILRRIEGWDVASTIEECTRFFPGGQLSPDAVRTVCNFNISRWR